MSVIYMLISISLVVAVGFLIAFVTAVKHGQYDDDYTPSVRMLFDDKVNPGPASAPKAKKKKKKMSIPEPNSIPK